jgi:hypothetical protein
MAGPNLLAIVGGIAVVAVIAAATEAAMRPAPTKSYDRCAAEARALGWNAADDEDQLGHNTFVARCQHGDRARLNPYGDAYAYAQPRQDDRRVARQSDLDRRAIAAAEAKYQRQAVQLIDRCRDLVTPNWGVYDDRDRALAARRLQNCMAGRVR